MPLLARRGVSGTEKRRDSDLVAGDGVVAQDRKDLFTRPPLLAGRVAQQANEGREFRTPQANKVTMRVYLNRLVEPANAAKWPKGALKSAGSGLGTAPIAAATGLRLLPIRMRMFWHAAISRS